jgi:NAD(P)-dependent dehydrogenase (short-subunit alcohol dehydrogenase family)
MLLPDRVAIITGGATGIGRSIAAKFADEGCNIAGVALFLASELSSFVAGTSIPVRGGIPLKPTSQSPMVRAT